MNAFIFVKQQNVQTHRHNDVIKKSKFHAASRSALHRTLVFKGNSVINALKISSGRPSIATIILQRFVKNKTHPNVTIDILVE